VEGDISKLLDAIIELCGVIELAASAEELSLRTTLDTDTAMPLVGDDIGVEADGDRLTPAEERIKITELLAPPTEITGDEDRAALLLTTIEQSP
jgi:hypothetical protein